MMVSDAEFPATDAGVTRVISDCDGRRLLLLTVTCLAVVLLTTLACNSVKLATESRRHGMHVSDVVSMEMKLTDVDGVLGKQHLISSVVSNYVTYHVVKASQHMWILDDFQHNVHVMKVSTAGEDAVCYVTPLNRSQATEPHVYAARNSDVPKSYSEAARSRRQTVLMAADLPITDRNYDLGPRAAELCRDAPVFSAHPLSDSRNYSKSRSKRHVKKCVMSCCHLVCCCNQKYLHWHSDDNFNCEHVCHGCTPASLTKIDRKC